MLSKIFGFIKTLFFFNVPKLEKEKLSAEENRANMSKVTAVAVTFIVLEIIRTIALLIREKGDVFKHPDNLYLSMYLFLIVVMGIFLAIFSFLEQDIAGHKIAIPTAGTAFTFILLFWCAGISLLDQESYGQIIVYQTAVISIAVVPICKPMVLLLIYTSVQGFFLMFLPYVQKSESILYNNSVNSTLYIVLSMVIAWIRYKTWVDDYRNREIIQQKTDEICIMNNKLGEANKRLKELSETDSLTGVYNRAIFDKSMQTEWFRCKRYAIPLSLYMIDIDFFKAFNDHYGHQAGDDCIKRIARALLDSVKRASDVVVRYGGDEFSVILPHLNREEALQLVNRLSTNIVRLKIPHEYSPVSDYVTVSIGVHTIVPSDGLTLEEFVKDADDALYQAKRKRNSIVVYE